MWFAGLLTGAFIGWLDSAGAAFFGAAVGTIVGAIVGSALKSRPADGKAASGLADLELKINHIYKSLEDIHRRLVRLEQPGEQQRPAATSEVPDPDAYRASTATGYGGDYAIPWGHAEGTAQTIPAVEAAAAEAVSMASATPTDAPPSAVQAAELTRAEEPAPPPQAGVATGPQPTGPFVADDAHSDTPFVNSGPSWWQRLFAGNIVAKVGVVILFFGVGFLLKYAYDHALLPVPLRLAGVAAVGFAMLYGGWKLQATRRLYGLILQGAGIGLLYLDVFFALRIFALIHPTLGFALFMALGVAATLLAVRQDAKVLAVLGLSGAFLAPVLAGSRDGDHMVLFSYYTLLNGFIVAVSWFKSWRDLNLTGFIFTFIVGVVWGASNYRPELFATVEPFVLIFFAMYLVIPILFAARQPPELKGLVDGTLVFGTPLSAAFMQAALVRDLPYGLAWSAGCAAGLYALLALLVIRREGMRLLGETYVALAVVFATMTIFFALDAYPTFALWTLEGAAIVWVGLRQKRLLARLFGVALQFGGAALFLLNTHTMNQANPWFNDFVLGCLLIAAAGMITSWLMHKHREVLMEGGKAVTTVMLLWACGWWFAGGLNALYDGVPRPHFHAAAMIFAATSFVLAETVGGWLAWASLRLITLAHLPAIVLGMLTIGSRHPLAELGMVAWPLNFVVLFWCLHWQQRDGLTGLHGARYRLGWLALAVLATWEALWLLDHHYYRWSWTLGALGIIVGWLRFYLRERDRATAAKLSVWVLLWGLAFWLLSGFGFIEEHIVRELRIASGLGFVAGSCALFEIVGAWLGWTALRRAQVLLLPAMALAALLQLERDLHPGAESGWLAWSAAFVAFYAILYRQQRADIALGAPNQHVLAVWLATGVVAWELAWQFELLNPGTSWPFAMWGLAPAVAMLLLAHHGKHAWPWQRDFGFYCNMCLGPMALYVLAWSLFAVTDPARAAPLPYLPLANPVDLTQAAVLFALHAWIVAAGATTRERESEYLALLAGLGFVWANSIVLRSIHHWFGVPFTAHALFNSIVVQAAFSLLWTVAAMALMVTATRKRQRKLWLVGVALLTMVVGKLFLLDLENSGTVARIVSFLGVGALVMLIGYVAPVPPGVTEKQRDY